jgi:hypothetical protein
MVAAAWSSEGNGATSVAQGTSSATAARSWSRLSLAPSTYFSAGNGGAPTDRRYSPCRGPPPLPLKGIES